MLKTLKRWWKYLGAKLSSSFNEKADPKVQLEQAITEAQEQHRRLKEQAANVIANQKTTEMQLEQTLGELSKVNTNARQALLMADEARKKGDTAKEAEYTHAAEAFANRLIVLEAEVESLKALALQAATASDQAKAAVEQNSARSSSTSRWRRCPRPSARTSRRSTRSARRSRAGSPRPRPRASSRVRAWRPG
jgi:phage shock protein A